jgi:hypothetical protein
MSPAFVDPPENLESFPALEFVGQLWRIHDEDNRPDYFGSSGDFRFDLVGIAGQGHVLPVLDASWRLH